MTDTQKALQEMFTFNTGSHMLDSGGAYGRHHERNRALATAGKTYLDLEPATVNFGSGWIEYTRQVCPWLEEQCDYREDLQTEFDAFATNDENKDETRLECLRLWLESKDVEAKWSENTYNRDCCISQVIQYTIFELEDENVTIAAVCLHQGCDVRGGYSKPFFFEVDDYIYGAADGYLRCSNANEDHHWTTDNTCTWYWHGCHGPDFKNLEDYKLSDDPKDKGKGKIYYDDEGKGYCPICGELLVA